MHVHFPGTGFLAPALMLFVLMGAGCVSSTDGGPTPGGKTLFTVFTTENGLADNGVTDIAVDYLRNGVWLATRNGLSFFSNADSSFTTYGAESVIPDLEITSVVVDFTGSVWVGTVSGPAFLALGDSFFRTMPDAGNLVNRWVTDILRTNDTSLWFGTRAGISVKKPTGWVSYSTALVQSYDITSLALDSLSRICAGSTNGVVVFDGTKWIFYGIGVLPDTKVNTVYNDNQGTMWVGTDSGASSFDGATWINHGLTDGLPATGIFRFVRDHTDVLRAATSSGVYSLNGQKWQKLALPQEISGSVVTSLADDSVSDMLWIGTENGAVRYRLSAQ